MPDQSLAILELVARSERPLPIKAIMDQLAIPRSSAFRIVDDLIAEGWLRAEGSPRRVTASWRTAEIGLAAIETHPYRNRLFPLLAGLAAESGDAAHLAFYDYGEAVFPDLVEVVGDRVIHTHSFGRLPALRCAAGQAVLAYLPPDELDALFEKAPSAETNEPLIRSQIARVRECGYAYLLSEARPGRAALAAPVTDQRGLAVAVLGLHDLTIADTVTVERRAAVVMKWTRRASTVLGAKAVGQLS